MRSSFKKKFCLKGVGIIKHNLIAYINILKFKINDTSRCECTGGGIGGDGKRLVGPPIFSEKTFRAVLE